MIIYRVKLEMTEKIEDNFAYACQVFRIDPDSSRKKKTIVRKIIHHFKQLHKENVELKNQITKLEIQLEYEQQKKG